MPMLQTARGVVFLDGAAEAAPPGVLVEPAELRANMGPDGQEDDMEVGAPTPGQRKAKVQGSDKPDRPVVQSASAADAAKELEQFSKWLAKGKAPEDFEFRVLDPVAADMLKAAAGAGGGAGPKAPHNPYSRPAKS